MYDNLCYCGDVSIAPYHQPRGAVMRVGQQTGVAKERFIFRRINKPLPTPLELVDRCIDVWHEAHPGKRFCLTTKTSATRIPNNGFPIVLHITELTLTEDVR